MGDLLDSPSGRTFARPGGKVPKDIQLPNESGKRDPRLPMTQTEIENRAMQRAATRKPARSLRRK